MFRRADLTDLYSLADPERCKGYLIVAADALDDVFVKMSLYPKRGDDGTFYFQKLEGIRRAHPRPEQQRQLCQQIAFFFIRIFQIYAALALSVMDSELPATDPQDIEAIKRTDGAAGVFIQPPGLAGFPQARKRFGPFTFRGGALSTDSGFNLTLEKAGIYIILNRYLVRPEGGLSSQEPMRFQGFDMQIPQNSLYTNESIGPGRREGIQLDTATNRVPQVLCTIDHLGKPYYISGKLYITRSEIDSRKLKVELRELTASSTKEPKTIEPLSGFLEERHHTNTDPRTETGENLPVLLKDLFTKAFEKLVAPPFSAVNFLRKFELIKSIDSPNTVIEGTRTMITSPPKHIQHTDTLPIQYRDRIKVNDRERDISINVTLKIERSHRPLNADPQKYRVVIQYTGMETTPEGLRSYLQPPSKTEETFSTGLLDKTVPRSLEKHESISQFIQGAFERLLKPLRERGVEALSRDQLSYTREGYPKPINSDAIPDDLRVKKVWEALLRTPPLKAHCVARAVQLLNVAAIKGTMTKEAFSSACRLRFPYSEDGSLPREGRPIISSIGISALSNLFVERVLGGAPKISSNPQVLALGRRMKQFFEGLETLPESGGHIEGITNKRPEICGGREDSIINLNPSIAGKLRSYAKILMSRQAQHLRSVMAILFKLFSEERIRAGVFEIHPKVMANGMDYLNRLAEEARGVLLEYYSGCEETYRAGIRVLSEQAAQRASGAVRGARATRA